MKKRWLSIFLSLCMIFTLLPMTVLALPGSGERFNALVGTVYIHESGLAVESGGPTRATTFEVTEPTLITGICNYHWLTTPLDEYEDATFKLVHSDSTVYGPWSVSAGPGSGRENVYWYAFPNEVIKPGTYTLIDSNNDTWSWTANTGNKGISVIKGGAPYDVTAPTPVETNGVTATLVFDFSSYVPGNTVNATVNLFGTAASAGTHTVGLASTKADITAPSTVTKDVLANDTIDDDFVFTFVMPAAEVDDFTLTHTFAPAPPSIVTDLVIEDAIAPINGAAPVGEIAQTEQYTAAISWDDSPELFSPGTAYTATITLSAKEGYTFDGILADAFSVPCAATATNEADSGVITATFWSPPTGYITDGNGAMAYRYIEADYYRKDRFDIYGTYNGKWIDTTCGDGGYGTKYKFNNESPIDVATTGKVEDVGNDITMQVQLRPYGGGRFLRIVYILQNSGSETATVSFGSHADTQIGQDDNAPITKFDDGRGFKMVNNSSYYGNMGAQFNFFGKGTIGVTDVDTYWFGNWSSRENNVFNQVEIDSSSGDSGMAYSWKDKTLAPGQTRSFSVLIGIGDAQSGDNVPIGVNFDSQGGSDVDTIIVDMAGDTIFAPTSPTRSGYTFGGWYTDEECTNQFSFETPITATITLYAKWTKTASSSGGGGGSSTLPRYFVTNENQGAQVGGRTNLSKDRAEAGSTVIITVTPDKGYKTEKPVVFDSAKKPLAVTDNGNGTFSFKMPVGGVSVKTEFTKIDYFDDVNEDDWFDEAAWYCAAHGLMQGTGDRQFDGDMGTNRAMLVTVLYRLANGIDSLESIFEDVESGKWYSDAIGWAAHNKIVEGYGDGRFGPDDALTREQMVSVLYRYSMFMKYDISKLNDLDNFTDADVVSSWAIEAMKWAVGNKIVEGVSSDLVSPETGATRAQFAAMMQRYVAAFTK